MKEYLKLFGKWTVFGLGFFFVLLVLWAVTFFVIKSRTATDPGLWDNGSSLYTSVNETLTAAKRNALVKSTKRQDVSTWDTALFDQNCERRRKGQGNDWNIRWFYAVLISLWWQYITAWNTSYYRHVYNDLKWTISENDSALRTMQKLQKRCQ